jgi:hypothetical protein
VSAEDFQAVFSASEQLKGSIPVAATASLLIAQLFEAGRQVAMLSGSSGVRLLITGNAPRPVGQAPLGTLSDLFNEAVRGDG